MTKKKNILISLASRFADQIFAGQKLVELRRRTMNVAPGTIVWIYVKVPVGSLVGRVRVKEVHALSPAQLWSRFGAVSGLTHQEFFAYFEGVARGFALVLEGAQRLRTALTLANLRKIKEDFTPPQFFVDLTATHPVLVAVTGRPPGRR